MMQRLIAQQGDFTVCINDHKCYTSLDICGGITDCVTGEFIVKYNDEDIFHSTYHYVMWDMKHTFKLYYNYDIKDIYYIKSILRHMPKENKILRAILDYKKN